MILNKKSLWILLLAVFTFCNVRGYAQQISPSEAYYQNHIGGQAPLSELPSDAYYNQNLRSGPPTGPGGSGEGGNEGTGTQPAPVGDAGYSLLLASLLYGLWISFGRGVKVGKRKSN